MTRVSVHREDECFDVSIVKDETTDESVVFTFTEEARAEEFAKQLTGLLNKFNVQTN